MHNFKENETLLKCLHKEGTTHICCTPTERTAPQCILYSVLIQNYGFNISTVKTGKTEREQFKVESIYLTKHI